MGHAKHMFRYAVSKAAIIAAIVIIIAIIAGVAYYFTTMQKGPTKIIWASTQLCPPEEQQFVKGTLLAQFEKETGIKVEFVAMSYSDLATRLSSEEKAGKVTIDVIGDLHGGLDLYASKGYLMDLSQFGTLSGRTFPKVLMNYAHMHGILAYIP